MALEQNWTCDSSDINSHGETLGYDWNSICGWMQECEIYGQDGEGSCAIYHSKTGDTVANEDLQKIIDSLLDTENIDECEVIDE